MKTIFEKDYEEAKHGNGIEILSSRKTQRVIYVVTKKEVIKMTENKIMRQEAREQALQEVKRLNKYIEQSRYNFKQGRRTSAINLFSDGLASARYWINEILIFSENNPTDDELEIINLVESRVIPIEELAKELEVC